LVEVVGVGFLGDLVCLSTAGPHVEFGLRRSPGGVDQRRRRGFSDMARIRMMGSWSVRKAMKVRGVWQAGEISGKTS
jgi:hypothetical protein